MPDKEEIRFLKGILNNRVS